MVQFYNVRVFKKLYPTDGISSGGSRVFLMNFKMFGNVMKHSLECLM